MYRLRGVVVGFPFSQPTSLLAARLVTDVGVSLDGANGTVDGNEMMVSQVGGGRWQGTKSPFVTTKSV